MSLSTADGLLGDVTNVEHVPAVDDERNAALAARMSLFTSSLLAFAGEGTNVQHGLVDATDRAARQEVSPATGDPVLATLFGGRVICSLSSPCRLFPRRRDHRVLPSDLRSGETGIRGAVRTSGGETTRSPPPLIPGPAGDNTLATGDADEPVRPNAGLGEAKNATSPPSLPVDPVRAGFGEVNNAMTPVSAAAPAKSITPRRCCGWTPRAAPAKRGS